MSRWILLWTKCSFNYCTYFERKIFFICPNYSGVSGDILYWCHALKELHLTSYCLFYGPLMKRVCACVCWTRVGQWVTVAGCGSELWAFACFCVCPDEAEGSAMQPHEGADA